MVWWTAKETEGHHETEMHAPYRKSFPSRSPSRGNIYHLTLQNDIFSNNDVFFVLDWRKWGAGAIDKTLTHARFGLGQYLWHAG